MGFLNELLNSYIAKYRDSNEGSVKQFYVAKIYLIECELHRKIGSTYDMKYFKRDYKDILNLSFI